MKIWKTIAIAAVLSGCASLGGPYKAPEIAVPARFVGTSSSALQNAADIQWWHGLNDAHLNDLITRGLAQNLDIAASLERIRAAQFATGLSGLNAQISGALSSQRTRAGTLPGTATTQATSTTANAQYVFDLFGGVQQGTLQAQASLEQATFSAGTVRLGYLAEITSAYVQARYFQNAAEITRQSISQQQRTLELVQFRVEVGDAARLEEQQALERLNSFKASLPTLIAGFEAQTLRIATLLAEPAGPILARMQRGASQPWPRRTGRTGLPADVVRNRPDVRAAERGYAAAVAAVGVAQAQLYPSLSISGRLAASTPDTWSFGPTVSLPLLNRGALLANKKVAASNATQAEIAWRAAVFSAIEDVQIAHSSLRNTGAQIGALTQVIRSSTELVSLSEAAYEAGSSPLTDVLSAELSRANNRLSLARARMDYALAWIQLQIAAGKGWAPGADG